MSLQIFVNLAVKDLGKSMAFFAALGYAHNPTYTGNDSACIVLSEQIYVMLLSEGFFRTFTDKAICDTRTHVESWNVLSMDSRARVDDLVAKAVAAGGREPRAAKDYGFMYSRAIEDLDGHTWVLMHMSGEPPKA
jgi:predicted lactoylglutathione lyase